MFIKLLYNLTIYCVYLILFDLIFSLYGFTFNFPVLIFCSLLFPVVLPLLILVSYINKITIILFILICFIWSTVNYKNYCGESHDDYLFPSDCPKCQLIKNKLIKDKSIKNKLIKNKSIKNKSI